MPENSVFYEKIVPVLLIGFALALIFVILLVAGLALGVIPGVLPAG